MEKFLMLADGFPPSSEIEAEGYRLKTRNFDCFYTNNGTLDILIDEYTGIVIWGAYNKIDKITDKEIEKMKKLFDDSIIYTAMLDLRNKYISQGQFLSNCKASIPITFLKDKLISFTNKKNGQDVLNKIVKDHKLFHHFRFFEIQGNHTDGTICANSMFVYPEQIVMPAPRKTNIIDISKFLPESTIPHAYCLYLNEPIRRGYCDEMFKFMSGANIIAMYYPDNNVLIMPFIIYSKNTTWLTKFFTLIKTKLPKKFTKEPDGFDITVGCDPEFELFNKKDTLLIGNDLNADGRLQRKIGADGAGRQLELRPDPSTDPKDVVDDLANMFRAVSHLRISSTGDREPLGGHIHMGVYKSGQSGKIKLTQNLRRCLDHFVGKHVIDLSGKARNSYKQLDQFREQPWGFEYRTPPAAVFATKKMARITIQLIKNIILKLNSETLEASIPLKLEDLEKLLPKKDAKYYYEFPKRYKKLNTDNIAKYWCKPKTNGIEIRFFDKWSEEVKKVFIDGLTDTITDSDTVLCLYGLKKASVAGLVDTEYPNVPHPRGVHCEEGISIGIPLDVRVGNSSSRQIIQSIKGKIGSLNGSSTVRTTANMFPQEMIGTNYDEEDSSEFIDTAPRPPRSPIMNRDLGIYLNPEPYYEDEPEEIDEDYYDDEER